MRFRHPSLWIALLATGLAVSAADPAAAGTVPLVNCALNEMPGGAVVTPQSVTVDLDADLASTLAYYGTPQGPRVFGPRGWSCHAWEGSGGRIVLISPRRLDPPYVPPPTLDGPAVLLQTTDRTESGRFHVAIVAAQLFPVVAAEFIDSIRQEKLISDDAFAAQSFPDDRLRYLSDQFVLYTTPANRTGLGTESLLEVADLPISGLTQLRLSSEGDALTEIRVRLPRGLAAADAAIIDLETRCVQQPKPC